MIGKNKNELHWYSNVWEKIEDEGMSCFVSAELTMDSYVDRS